MSVSSETINGTASTSINTAGGSTYTMCGASYRVGITGSMTGTVTYGGSNTHITACLDYQTGADQTTPVDSIQTDANGFGSSSVSTTVTSATGDMVSDVGSSQYSAITGQTLADSRTTYTHASGGDIRSSTEAGAASVSTGYSGSFDIHQTVAWNINAALLGGPKGPLGHPLHGPLAGPVGP